MATTLTAGTAASDGVHAPGRRHEDDYNLIAHALTSEGADASEDGTGRGTPLAVVPDVYTVSNDSYPVVGQNQVGALKIGTGLGIPSAPAITTPTAVRRLSPLECERLQGFPDGWTRLQADGTEQSDSARYRQLGNAVAVPVVAWITRRIAAVERSAAVDAEGAA